MRREGNIGAVLLLAVILIAVPASAATVVFDSGSPYVTDEYGTYYLITEVNGLYVAGYGTYDVDFVFDKYQNIWGSGYDFQTPEGASKAIRALNDALNDIDWFSYHDVQLTYDPGVLGTEEYQASRYYVPYVGGSGNKVFTSFSNNDFGFDDGYSATHWRLGGVGLVPVTSDKLYAKFNMVPIPGAVWLLGSGLIGLVGIRKKIRK